MSPRRQVAPLVRLVGRVLVVGGVARVHLGRSVTNEQCSEGLINKGGVGDPRAHAPCTVEELRVHGRAQSCAIHAISMPLCSEERPGRPAMTATSVQPPSPPGKTAPSAERTDDDGSHQHRDPPASRLGASSATSSGGEGGVGGRRRVGREAGGARSGRLRVAHAAQQRRRPAGVPGGLPSPGVAAVRLRYLGLRPVAQRRRRLAAPTRSEGLRGPPRWPVSSSYALCSESVSPSRAHRADRRRCRSGAPARALP